jgi:type II secretory pathway pseudopilin PulG
MNRHQGFTLLEAVASIFILTLTLTTVLTLIVNVTRQSAALNAKVAATEIGTLIREDLENDSTYALVSAWQGGVEKTITLDSCVLSPFGCGIFEYANGSDLYDDNVTVTFLAPTTESETFKVIHFVISINYYGTRTVEMQGIIYEE